MRRRVVVPRELERGGKGGSRLGARYDADGGWMIYTPFGCGPVVDKHSADFGGGKRAKGYEPWLLSLFTFFLLSLHRYQRKPELGKKISVDLAFTTIEI